MRWVQPELRPRRRSRSRLVKPANLGRCPECGIDMDWLSWGADAALQAAIDGVVSYWCALGVSRIAAANLGAALRQWWWHARRNALRGLGYDPDRSLIEWEHEIPLWSRFTWEGEGSVRWVCQRCHAAKTAAEARQRIRARREAKA